MASTTGAIEKPVGLGKPAVSAMKSQKEKRQISPTLSLISGGIAGGVEATVTVHSHLVS